MRKRVFPIATAALVALTGCGMAPAVSSIQPEDLGQRDGLLSQSLSFVTYRDVEPVPIPGADEVVVEVDGLQPDTRTDLDHDIFRNDVGSEELQETQEETQEATQSAETAGMTRAQKAAYYKAFNPAVVGWVYVPDANIDNVILHYTGDNEYYLYRDFNGNQTREGSFYADYRARFGAGTRSELKPLTTLYGHSFRDDPNSGLFSGIKNFRNEEFARTHPYIYFSTWEEDLAFEVVAVFESHVHIPYNRFDITANQYRAMLETVSYSTLYNYNAVVSEDDKLLVLSTCAMNVQGHQNLDPYATDYRFVVMARLVEPGTATKEYADFTVNANPAGPDVYRSWWESQLID